jgi:hypothetical protein
MVEAANGLSVQSSSLLDSVAFVLSLDAGRKSCVVLSGTDRLAVIDMAARQLVKMIDGVGDQPRRVSSVGELGSCH